MSIMDDVAALREALRLLPGGPLRSAANASAGVVATLNVVVDQIAPFKAAVDNILTGHPATADIVEAADIAQEAASEAVALAQELSDQISVATVALARVGAVTGVVAVQLSGNGPS